MKQLFLKEKALLEASAHVSRQAVHGKHEQDKQDAEEWLSNYKDLVHALLKKRASKKGPWGPEQKTWVIEVRVRSKAL